LHNFNALNKSDLDAYKTQRFVM